MIKNKYFEYLTKKALKLTFYRGESLWDSVENFEVNTKKDLLKIIVFLKPEVALDYDLSGQIKFFISNFCKIDFNKINLVLIEHKKPVKKPETTQKPKQNIEFAQNIIAIAACKGGVGKSTVAFLLANQLAEKGFKVGLLDADIYGPSVPIITNLENYKPETNTQKQMIPASLPNGLKVMSIGFLVPDASALIWRGPMIGKAINTLLFGTEWKDLDYLIIDLPPGTGDIYLSLFQLYSIKQAILVTTPHILAVKELQKTIAMFETLDVEVKCILENMADFENKAILGDVDIEKFANDANIKYAGKLSISDIQALKKQFYGLYTNLI